MVNQQSFSEFFSANGRHNVRRLSFGLLFVDMLILLGSFMTVHYIRQSSITPSLLYWKLLFLIGLSTLLSSLLSKKYYVSQYAILKSGLLTISSSAVVATYIASFMILLRGLYAFSRGQLLGSILLFFAIEIVVYLLCFVVTWKNKKSPLEIGRIKFVEFKDFSLSLLFNDIVFLLVSFLLMNYIKRQDFTLSAQYQDIFLLVSAIWLTTSMFTKKFNVLRNLKVSHIVAVYIKAYILALLTMAVLIFVFRLFYYSRVHFFGTFSILLLLEMISTYLNYMTWVYEPNKAGDENTEDLKKMLNQENIPIKKDITSGFSGVFAGSTFDKIFDNLVYVKPELVRFLTGNIKITDWSEVQPVVLATDSQSSVEAIGDHSTHLFINLHKVNDFKRINRYLLSAHRAIDDNGFFVGCAETNDVVKKRFFQGTFEFVGYILYGLYFLLYRVVPKISVLNKVYFMVTRGKERALSKAELFGRLSFCGFKVVAESYFDDRLYFVAQRDKYPSVVQNPSYGLIVKLPRIGMHGEIKFIYKFRTMHPYSEFLQAYIYERSKLDKSGKMAEDFRLTGWGKVFRKFWIDELPQIINFFQGDLAIFGVRALSQQYFNLYPKDLQDLRTEFKPGLIPPYYADLPQSFEEILASERRYLEKKKVMPFRTDMEYFFKALYNIVIKKARSK